MSKKKRTPLSPKPAAKKKTSSTMLWVILGLAFAARLAYLLLGKDSPFYQPILLDPGYYHKWAIRMTRGDFGQGVFYGLPLYPFFVAVCYKIFNYSLFAVKFIQLLLGVVTVYFTYKIGERLADRRVGLLAAFIAALYGPLIFHESILIPESIGVPLYAAAFYWACLFHENPSKRNAVLFGVLSGLAALTKAGILLFALSFFIILFIQFSKNRKKTVTSLVFGVAAFLAMLAPVTAHNYFRAKDAVLLTSHAGFNFYIGNNPQAEGVFTPPEGTGSNVEAQMADSRFIAEAALGRGLKASEVSKYWSGKAWEFIQNNPSRFLWLSVRKLALFFDAREISDVEDYAFEKNFNPFLRWPLINFTLLGPLLILGLVAAWKKIKDGWIAYLWVGSYIIGIISFFINARYRLPLLSLFFVFAAVGSIHLYDSAKNNRWARAGTLTLVLGAGIWLTRLELVGTNFVRNHVNAGDAYLERNEPQAALSLYQKALEINSRDPKANLATGIVLSKLGREEEAKNYYEKSLEVDPNSSQAFNNLGLWHDRHGDLDRAEVLFKKAIELKPTSSQAYNNLGMVYGKRGQNQEAAQALETALKLNPESVKAHTNLGLVYHRLGKKIEAEREWEMALQIDPAFTDARRALDISRQIRE